jgi:diadenosine tetraphosphate (Ap4A) HIT family hydrolase
VSEPAAHCELCELHRLTEAGDQPWSVARLGTGYVALNPNQFFRGYTFFSARTCTPELFDLDRDERAAHLYEMTEVARAIQLAFGPRKLNYEALGNSVAHLHWHLVPRHEDDPRPWAPIWENLDFLRSTWTGQEEPDPAVRHERRAALAAALAEVDVEVERHFT